MRAVTEKAACTLNGGNASTGIMPSQQGDENIAETSRGTFQYIRFLYTTEVELFNILYRPLYLYLKGNIE